MGDLRSEYGNVRDHLKALIGSAENVVEAWEGGDLAGAVNRLRFSAKLAKEDLSRPVTYPTRAALERLMVGLTGQSTPNCDHYDGILHDAFDEARNLLNEDYGREEIPQDADVPLASMLNLMLEWADGEHGGDGRPGVKTVEDTREVLRRAGLR